MSTTSLIADFLSSLSRRPSLRSLASRRRKNSSSSSSTPFYSYTVHHQTMFPAILRDSDTTKKLLECISDFPSGRRSLARISRTCRALSEPAMNMLWRELDSFVPLLALFPSSLLKRSRRPGLGLARVPAADDWDKVLHYGNKVQRITYDETLNNVAPAIFPIFEEHRPRTFILPNLTTLTWKVETPAGLDRCLIFLSPTLQSLTLEMNGSRFPQLESFLSDMTTRCPQLTSFSFMSHTIPLRDSFTEVLAPLDDSLERLTLAAPGVLSPRIGSWVLSLPKLKSLQIDLYGRSANIVDIFFSSSSSRASTPSTDSGVFSGEDDLEIIKPGIKHFRLVRFEHLCHLSLTGEIAVITGFLRHLDGCGLIQLDLVVDDPPAQKGSWKKAWAVICDQFATTLQSLRINATASSRFSDLVQATSRGEPASHGIALSTLSPLPVLSRFEVDLPASTIITASDIEKVANTCPNLEILRLCPVSRFPHANSPPRISLESLAPLLSKCRRLHTLAIVVNAQGGSEETLESTETSESLLRLHVGHSWISDPLPVTILLSHLAPQLDTLRWFHEKNRPGVVEANAEAWREVSEALPHLRSVRMAERLTAKKRATPVIIPRVLVDRSVDATVRKASRGVTAMPRMANAIVQCRVPLINQGVLAKPRVSSAGVTARPRLVDAMVDVRPPHREQSIEARPTTIGASIDATVSTVSKCVDAVVFTDPPSTGGLLRIRPHIWILSAVFQLLSIARTIFVSYPLYIPSRILSLIMCKYHQYSKISKPKSDDGAGTGAEEVSMQTLSQVRP